MAGHMIKGVGENTEEQKRITGSHRQGILLYSHQQGILLYSPVSHGGNFIRFIIPLNYKSEPNIH